MTITDAPPLLSLPEVAIFFAVPAWRVRRLYERKLLPDPKRVGRNRVVKRDDLPAVKRALLDAGYLEPTSK